MTESRGAKTSCSTLGMRVHGIKDYLKNRGAGSFRRVLGGWRTVTGPPPLSLLSQREDHKEVHRGDAESREKGEPHEGQNVSDVENVGGMGCQPKLRRQ